MASELHDAVGPPPDLAQVDEQLQRFRADYDALRQEVGRVVVGQLDVLDHTLLALLTGQHVLLEGVPGLGKTLLVRTLAAALHLSFQRIQFTPDLMPADLIGTNVVAETPEGRRQFQFQQGPVFANVLLADEINRATPKTQSALLEAMAERRVTVAGTSHVLPSPFFVLATQNPIEQEGTYPLPEAQQDRFMFKVFVKYPSFNEEFEIARRTTALATEEILPVLTGEQILDLQRVVRKVPVTDHVIQYTLALVRQTRVGEAGVPKFVREWLSWGAGPRAVQYLILGAKARALLYGRAHVQTEDIQALALPVLRHRLLTNFTAASEGVTTDTVIERLVKETPSREGELTKDDRFKKIFAT
jgi:MoxR-like ATPase